MGTFESRVDHQSETRELCNRNKKKKLTESMVGDHTLHIIKVNAIIISNDIADSQT